MENFNPIDFGLGRREPDNFDHVEKFPFSAVAPTAPFNVEKLLTLPTWHKGHNQGAEGACVGFGTSMMLTILNEHQCRLQGQRSPYIRYNPWWLWDRAKEIDQWADTNPGDNNGTSVRAACEILQKRGHVLWEDEKNPKSCGGESRTFGVGAYRWARTVDEVRQAIAMNLPVSIGVNWYSAFDQPIYKGGEWFIGLTPAQLGTQRGGHCVCIYGASDARQAFRVKNSWGEAYPEVWMPYQTLQRLLNEGGEVALITDL